MFEAAARDQRNSAVIVAVLVNYRSPQVTAAAVAALARSSHRLDRVVVVDNGSGDGSVERLRSLPAEVKPLPTNLGFPAGANAGIREALAAGADRILLVNSDVVVGPATVENLLSAFENDTGIGVAGPLIVQIGSPERIESAGVEYSARTGRMKLSKFGAGVSRVRSPETRAVEAVSGAVMLIRREVFERVGLFDEEFFFGFEDLDFCMRARDAGFRVVCVESAVATHAGQASIGRRSPSRIYFATRNHLRLAARRSAPPLGRMVQTASILSLNLAHALFTSEVPSMQGLRAFARGARDHFAGRYGPPPTDLSASAPSDSAGG